LLGLWGAIFRLVPWFGAVIAVLPALFVGLSSSPLLGLLALLYAAGIMLTLQLVIEPRFFPRYKYSSLLIVLFVIALAQAFGFIGVILAPPLAVAVQILFRHLYPLATPTFSTETAEQVAGIKERLSQLKRRIQDPRQRQIFRLINRLDRLVNRATDYLQEY
jgi:predicted PurR-regulated permease PerM